MKTKVLMCYNRTDKCQYSLKRYAELERVYSFIYSENKILSERKSSGKSWTHIQTSRVVLVKRAFHKKWNIFTKRINTKKAFIKSFMWNVSLYGSETLHGLRISWTDKVKTDEVFIGMNTQKSTWNTFRTRRKMWIGRLISRIVHG